MKKILFIVFAFIYIPVFAKKISASKVPPIVKSTFSRHYPNATKLRWKKENDNYEANFMQDNNKMSATFEEHGGWLETETGIEVSALPASATDYIAKNYKGKTIKEAAKIKMANGDSSYEAEVDGMDLIFDMNGMFIRSEKD